MERKYVDPLGCIVDKLIIYDKYIDLFMVICKKKINK